MRFLDSILVALILLGAGLYLYKTFRPKKSKGGSCGCGTVDCKVPKVNLKSEGTNYKTSEKRP
jgi:hypothetical protein